VSATLYATYRRCPQQALARLHGIYTPPSRATFKGALAHRLFARHLRDGPIPDDQIDLVCRQETGSGLNNQLVDAGIARPSAFTSVVGEVGELYQRFRLVPMDGFEAAEVSFEDDVGGGVVLKGRIDAVFRDGDRVRIVDWKTGAELGDDVAAQLGFYAMAWKMRTGAAPAHTEAMSIGTGEKVITDPTVDDIDHTENEVAAMILDLRAALGDGSERDRTAGPHCRWCPILDGCREGASAVAILD
jgi:PD-(D/E)XK nuclease superfamily